MYVPNWANILTPGLNPPPRIGSESRKKQTMVALIIQLISGAVGGNIAGAVLSKLNLGPVGNSIAGIIGGGLGGQLLNMVLSHSGAASSVASAASGASGMDMSSILSSVGGGGVGGAVVMAIVGLIKSQMAKS